MKNQTITTVCGLTIIILLILTGVSWGNQDKPSISAVLSRDALFLGQNGFLTVTIHNGRSEQITLPETENFALYERERSTHLNMINGSFSQSEKIVYLLRPHAAGNFTIPPIMVTVEGSQLQTQPFDFTVKASANQPSQSPTWVAPPPSSPPGKNGESQHKTFIHVKGLVESGYVGQVIPLEITAYFHRGLRVNLTSYPRLNGNGAVIPEITAHPQKSEQLYQGNRYTVLTWHTTMTNIKEGDHQLRFEMDATQLLPQRRTSTSMFGNRSPFDDPFFDSFLGNYQEKPFTVVSDTTPHAVLPLPEENKPQNFSGAIGNFTIEASAIPLKVEQGEPITLTLSILGTGNFDRIQPPAFPQSEQWKLYSPASSFHGEDDKNYHGEKRIEQAIVAQTAAIKAIPAIEFSYFDPKRKQYLTINTEPIPLMITGQEVAPTASSPVPSPEPEISAPVATPARLLEGLAPLSLNSGVFVQQLVPAYKRAWFLVLVAVCLTLLCFITLKHYWQKRWNTQHNQQQKQLQNLLSNSFSALEQARATSDSSTFLATCRHALQVYFGQQQQTEASAVTSTDLARILPGDSDLLALFTLSEQGAYGAVTLSPDEMDRYIQLLRDQLGGTK